MGTHDTNHSRALREVTSSVAECRALLSVAATGASGENERWLQAVLEQACQLTGATQGSIMLREDDELVVAATVGHRAELLGRRVERSRGVAWRVTESGTELQIFGIFGQNEAHRDHRSSLVVPVFQGEECIGTLNVNRRSGGFSVEDFQWASLAAGLLGRAHGVGKSIPTRQDMWNYGLTVVESLGSGDASGTRPRADVISQLATAAKVEHMAPRLRLALQLLSAASALIPDTEAVQWALEPLETCLPNAAGVFFRGLGVDVDLCDILMLGGERWDGRGPLAKSGDEIPLAARVFAAANALPAGSESDVAAALQRVVASDPGRLDPALVALIATNEPAHP